MKKTLYPLACLVLATMVTACATNNTTPNNAPDSTTQNYNQAQPYRYGQGQGPNTFNSYGGFGTNNYGMNRVNDYDGYGMPGNYGTYYAGPNGMTDGTAGVNRTGAGNMDFDRATADKIRHAAQTVKGVDGAVAIVRGNEAIVGISTRLTTANSSQRQSIERKVHSAVRAVAPDYRIHVTSDTNLLPRIHNMDRTLQQNNYGLATGPTTVGGNLANVGRDFGLLVRDIGRTVTAPFR